MGVEEENDAMSTTMDGFKNQKQTDQRDEHHAKNNVTFKEKLRDKVYRRKCTRTFWLGVSFLALGITAGQRGAAFLDLQIITQTDVEAASFFFTSEAVGYVIGSLAAGVIYDKLNKSLVLMLSVLGFAVTTVAKPWCSPYGLMIAIHFCVGFFGGGLDAGSNAEVVHIWGKEGEMAMQFIHFAFAFGGVIGPLFTEPFLTQIPQDDVALHNTTASRLNLTVAVKNSNVTISPFQTYTVSLLNTSVAVEVSGVTDNSSAWSMPRTTDVHYAYMISGGLIFLTVIPLTVQVFSERAQKRRQDRKDEKKTVRQPLPTPLFLFVQSCILVIYFLYVAVEETFMAYLSTFVVTQLHWSKSSGAQITSLSWAFFALGRFLSIFAVHVLTSVKLLFLSCLALPLSVLGFTLLSEYGVNTGVWICASLAGISLAPVFPSGFSWMEEELVRVTGRVVSSIVVVASCAGMVNPIILGYLMQHLTPMWFSYLLFGQSVLCLCTFLFLLACSRFYLRRHYVIHETKTLEINVPALHAETSAVENSAM